MRSQIRGCFCKGGHRVVVHGSVEIRERNDPAAAACEIDPVSLYFLLTLQDAVFQNTAVFLNCACGCRICCITDHQHALYSPAAAFVQGKRNHLCAKSPTTHTGTDPIADVSAVTHEKIVQIMADVDGSHKTVRFGIQTEQRCIRHFSIPRFCDVDPGEICVKIMIVVFANRPGDDFLSRSGPFIHHFVELRTVFRRQAYKLQHGSFLL